VQHSTASLNMAAASHKEFGHCGTCSSQFAARKHLGLDIIWYLLSVGTLHSVEWQLITDISRQPIGPILSDETWQKDFFLDCLTLEYGTDRLSRNVITNYYSTLGTIVAQRRSNIHRGASLKSCHNNLHFLLQLKYRVSVTITITWYSVHHIHHLI
jgi:hypothetical protein